MSLTPEDRVRRTRVRGIAAVAILIAWSVAIVGLVRRDVVRTNDQKLSDLARHISPGSEFYVVDQDGAHIGWASSTIDTLKDSLVVRDALTADIAGGGVKTRMVTQTDVVLTRSFVLLSFTTETGVAAAPTRISGHVAGDSLIAYVAITGGVAGDTQRVHVRGPVLMPTLVPLAVMLGGKPKVGRQASFETFDPVTLVSRAVAVEIQAESLFVVEDSARKDVASGRWVTASRDTVRAWKLSVSDGPSPGWIDAQGRVVQSSAPGGLLLRRMAYELAFENWRLENADSSRSPATRDMKKKP
jgi:hypothetical protein